MSYAFDAPVFEISLNVRRPDDPKRETHPVYVTHVLRRPTAAQLEARERQSVAETISGSKGEDEIAAHNVAPDLDMWAQCIEQIKGYRGLTADPAMLTAWQPEWAGKIPAEHKLAAVRAWLAMECEIVSEDTADDEYFDVTADTVTVRQKIQGHEVLHTLRKPGEREFTHFKPFTMTTARQGVRTVTRFRANLGAYADLYDKLIEGITGATLDGQPFAVAPPTLKRIDPLTKRAVVQALMSAHAVALED